MPTLILLLVFFVQQLVSQFNLSFPKICGLYTYTFSVYTFGSHCRNLEFFYTNYQIVHSLELIIYFVVSKSIELLELLNMYHQHYFNCFLMFLTKLHCFEKDSNAIAKD